MKGGGGIRAAVRGRFLRFRREILVVIIAVRLPGTPLHLRLAGFAFLLYLASPIDLVPIVIPVLGLVDDLVIVPAGLSWVVSRLPDPVRIEADARAGRIISRWVKRPLVFFGALVMALLVIWIGILWLVLRWMAG
jgi:uncharacterized membrane protein YkvA (DUF1232 family)